MKGQIKLLAAVAVLLLNSCTTYYMSTDSLKQQFAGVDSTKLKKVELEGGGILMASGNSYLANPIKTINCTDKKGNPATLENGPSIEIRFTYGQNNKRTIFYFAKYLLLIVRSQELNPDSYLQSGKLFP
jgi:hypothetical protein